MTKKIITSLVAAAALTTSAFAYETSELGLMNKVNSNPAIGAARISSTSKSVSNSLLFPAFFTGNGWESTLRVINTSSTDAVVAKVVFYDGKDSHELRDFNIYLSANDEWMGTVKIVDGKATIISTDDSAPIEIRTGSTITMASAEHPMTGKLSSNSGYIEVIGMVEASANAKKVDSTHKKGTYVAAAQSYHGKHADLRTNYTVLSHDLRGTTSASIFKDGVVTSGAEYPYVDTTSEKNGFFVPAKSVLAGDVRITNTVNGTDMDMPAINIDYTTGTNALVYLEGEKANLADVEIDPKTQKYSFTNLESDLKALVPTTAYITYGDAAVNNNYALFTSPFKRTIAQLHNDGSATTYFTDAKAKTATTPVSYGSYSLTANIYDMSENVMSAGQFSPATTPTLVMKNELDTTGTDITDDTKLPYYLNQAASNGFNKGYVILNNVNTKLKIPAIVTQMMATTAGSTTVTNWIRPTTK